MDQVKKLCSAANLLVDMETTFCFNNRTNKRMYVVVKLNDKDFLITTVDANNPSNGFVKDSELSASYFPGAAAVLKARSKFAKYKKVIATSKEFVPFVIETQGSLGFHAREFFKSVYVRFQLRDLEYQEIIGNSKFLLHLCELKYLILSIDFTLLE